MPVRGYDGKFPSIAPSAWLDESAVVIGDVTVGEDSSLWPTVVARGDVHSIRIGNRTSIQDGCILHVTHDSDYAPGGFGVTVGDGVTVGHRVTLHGCTVEDLCLIGMCATIMDGAVVGAHSIVAAGSLVPGGRELEGGYLYMGSPVKRIRPLTDGERGYLEYAAAHYVELKNRYRSTGERPA